MVLKHKHILLGVTGGIAAYKSAWLVRLLIKEGAEVKVVMTPAASEFVTPQTLSVLSKNTVTGAFFDEDQNWNNHVHLAEWADLMIVAPLTANTLSKFASGLCDNVVTACYLSARMPVFVAPAMDLEMYRHSTTAANLHTLEANGHHIIPAESGELASGLSGEGRMAEPEHIVEFVSNYFLQRLPLLNKRVLVNAGPTYESIDPVRFIGNRSSGKTGIALADAFAALGADVTLVLGPSAYRPEQPRVTVIAVESAEDMFRACTAHFADCDIAVLSAAVADYRPKEQLSQKLKKTEAELHVDLVKTKDILAELGRRKTSQCLVGFALETENVEEYAIQKLKSKNLDLIVANRTSDSNKAFGSDSNAVTIIDKHNKIVNFGLRSKTQLAQDIVNHIVSFTGLK
ncbi:MAG: bifunctional phosphopantothenoylcysteine decarboxylase/phosphopantothenate--cysteine ligase CoaBC [Bacteroidia bacterium]